MGLFNTFMQGFNQARNAKLASQQPRIVLGQSWYGVPPDRIVDISTNYGRTLYSYEHAIFDSMADGQEITMYVLPYEFSTTDGNAWENGLVFTAGSDCPPMAAASDVTYGLIRKAMETKGVVLSVIARRNGTYDGIHADMELKWDNTTKDRVAALIYFDDIDAESVKIYLKCDSLPSSLTHDWSNANASIRRLPVPDGSKAKPHIMISIDGVDVNELSAHNPAYGDIANLPDGEVQAIARSNEEQGTGWIVIKTS